MGTIFNGNVSFWVLLLLDRPGLGDQGVAARFVGLPAQVVGVAALETQVLVGDSFALEARDHRTDPS